jgi:hypothetical protein
MAIHALAIDPTNDDVVYAGKDDGVFQTVDGVMNWSAVNSSLLNAGTAPSPVTQPQLKMSHTGGRLSARPPPGAPELRRDGRQATSRRCGTGSARRRA